MRSSYIINDTPPEYTVNPDIRRSGVTAAPLPNHAVADVKSSVLLAPDDRDFQSFPALPIVELNRDLVVSGVPGKLQDYFWALARAINTAETEYGPDGQERLRGSMRLIMKKVDKASLSLAYDARDVIGCS